MNYALRKAVCDPEEGQSFVAVLENDPESSQLDGGQAGWPPSAFVHYSVDSLQSFFGLGMNFPEDCRTDEAQNLVPHWAEGRPSPKLPPDEGKLFISLLGVGGKRVMYREAVWLGFKAAFGHTADFHESFTLEAPPAKSMLTPGWKADCSSLMAQQLPKLKSCSQSGQNIKLDFAEPIKGGTFLFKLSMVAPAGPLSHNQWTARVSSNGEPDVLMVGEGFELLPSHDWQEHFYSHWPFYAAAFLLVILSCLGCTRLLCTRSVRERRRLSACALLWS